MQELLLSRICSVIVIITWQEINRKMNFCVCACFVDDGKKGFNKGLPHKFANLTSTTTERPSFLDL